MEPFTVMLTVPLLVIVNTNHQLAESMKTSGMATKYAFWNQTCPKLSIWELANHVKVATKSVHSTFVPRMTSVQWPKSYKRLIKPETKHWLLTTLLNQKANSMDLLWLSPVLKVKTRLIVWFLNITSQKLKAKKAILPSKFHWKVVDNTEMLLVRSKLQPLLQTLSKKITHCLVLWKVFNITMTWWVPKSKTATVYCQ